MDPVLPCLPADDLVQGHVEKDGGPLVGKQDFSGCHGGDDYGNLGVVDQQPIAFLAVPQRLLCPLAFRDVYAGSYNIFDFTLTTGDRCIGP